MRGVRLLGAFAAVLALGGCDLATPYVRPPPPIPAAWPAGMEVSPAPPVIAEQAATALIRDPRLRRLVDRALSTNRDLRAALANAASARALYQVQHSQQLPTLVAEAGASVSPVGAGSALDTQGYFVQAGVNSFELDLYGRLKNLSRSAFESYLSTAEGPRAAHLTLVSQVLNAAIAQAADKDLLAVAHDTAASGERALRLTRSLSTAGLASGIDVQNAVTILEQARTDEQDAATRVAQDRDALQLLIGAPVSDAETPGSLGELDAALGDVPAGLSSSVLLQRPDVLQSEHQLRAAGAQIGAARAAFFPTLTLTSGVGLASEALSSFLSGGALSVSFAPTVSVPLLGGPVKGNLAYAKAQQELALANYQKAIQTAFRDVADGLARRATVDRQRAAQGRLVAASERGFQLAITRYRAGEGSFLASLINQRTLYAAQQSQIATVRVDLENRVALAIALGRDA